MEFLDKLKSFFTVNHRAYTALLVGGILSIMIGSIVMVVTYVILSQIFTVAASVMTPNSTLNASLYANLGVITQALTITGISLIVAGVTAIIAMLMGVAGGVGGAPGQSRGK
jgi:hypothetical protein